MTVIVVLSDCPPKLRGDMSKWFVEINTGVYVGNISARVRDHLWERIAENIGHGHATMVFTAPGEQHMDFRVHNAYWTPVDFDGIKLMRRPEQQSSATEANKKEGPISNVAKRKIATTHRKTDDFAPFRAASYVVLDLETTGLDAQKSEIIEIGALLVERGKITERRQIMVKCKDDIPMDIMKLTGITREALERDGMPLEDAVPELLEFAENLPFVCHNAPFEQSFLEKVCSSLDEDLENRFIDTLKLAQMLLPNLDNHKLKTLAAYFNLPYETQHRALADCEATYGIYTKLIELASLSERKNEK